MKKRLYLFLIVLIILSVFFSTTFGSEIRIAAPVTNKTINAALNVASPGDIIIIPNGEYRALSNRASLPIYLNNSGTINNRITLKAETPGGVTFVGTSYIEVNGDNWVISGIRFKNIRSSSPTTYALVVIHVNSDNTRITNCYFENIGQKYDSRGGAAIRFNYNTNKGEIDNCTFINWAAVSAIVPLKTYGLHISHNYFSSPEPSDHDSAIHFGTDSTFDDDLKGIVEYNLFYHVAGDLEIISNKSSSNIYRYNVFDGRNSPSGTGHLTLRKGNDCMIYGNHFYSVGGMLDSGNASIRVFGEGHKIYNNYIENTIKGIGLWIASGDNNQNPILSTGPSHVRAKDINIYNNSIINSSEGGIIIGAYWPNEKYDSENLIFKNNLISQTTGWLVGDYGHDGLFIWESNLHYNYGTAEYWRTAQLGGSEPANGITHADPKLIQGAYIKRLQKDSLNAIGKGTPIDIVGEDIDGQERDLNQPDIGADEYLETELKRKPVNESEVGVSWLKFGIVEKAEIIEYVNNQ